MEWVRGNTHFSLFPCNLKFPFLSKLGGMEKGMKLDLMNFFTKTPKIVKYPDIFNFYFKTWV